MIVKNVVQETLYGFNQTRLIENKLDLNDALILRKLKDLYACSKMHYIIENNNKYVWVNFSYLQKVVPIAGSLRTLQRKIESYYKMGLIDKITKHEKNEEKGNFCFVVPTEKLDDLENCIPDNEVEEEPENVDNSEPEDLTTKCHNPLRQNDVTLTTNCLYKDILNKYPINFINNICCSPDEFFEVIWKEYPSEYKRGKKHVKAKQRKALMKIGLEKLASALSNYIKDLENTGKFTMNGSTFFNSAYDDYLPENYTPAKPLKQRNNMQQRQPAQAQNYSQREYSDDFFSQFEG